MSCVKLSKLQNQIEKIVHYSQVFFLIVNIPNLKKLRVQIIDSI
jgi:hypothetical protein